MRLIDLIFTLNPTIACLGPFYRRFHRTFPFARSLRELLRKTLRTSYAREAQRLVRSCLSLPGIITQSHTLRRYLYFDILIGVRGLLAHLARAQH